jgi:hypothetical protein
MKHRKLGTTGMVVLMTALLSSAGSLAISATVAPMTPEVAAKRENFRKQDEQRITPEKRKAAADALKAERLKVHQAKQAAKQSTPDTTDNK